MCPSSGTNLPQSVTHSFLKAILKHALIGIMPYLKVGINKFQKDDRIFKEKVNIFIVFV